MQRRVVLVILIASLVGIVIGTVWPKSGDPACDEWQQEYTQAVNEGGGGVLGFIGKGPTAERLRHLEKQQPEDCPKPNL